MKKISEPIVFFGSGPVAAASLRLLAQDFVIEAVVTKPQPAHHKQPFPVLALADELNLNVLTASTKQELSGLFVDKPFKSRLGIIIDHGIIVAPAVINHFELGIVNSHFSLLPRWRGADPISFAILNGDTETGVSLMTIVEKLDEGALIAQRTVPITDSATTPSLTDELIAVSHELLVETLPGYIAGQIKPYPQPSDEPTYSRKLTKADSQIDWSKPATQIEREIRAYTGWPRSRTILGGKEVIINAAHVSEGSGVPASLELANKQLGVYCGQDLLIIDSLTPSGKKEMSAPAFLAGYSLQ